MAFTGAEPWPRSPLTFKDSGNIAVIACRDVNPSFYSKIFRRLDTAGRELLDQR